MQLFNLPLNHPFSKDLQKSLRCFKGQRHKPGPKSRSNDQRAVHPKLLQKRVPGTGQLIGTSHTFALCNEPLLHGLLN